MSYIHVMDYCSALKGRNFDVCYNLDEVSEHYVKWDNLVIKRKILYDSTSVVTVRKTES